MSNSKWIKADKYMERSVYSLTNGIWVVEIYNTMAWDGLNTAVRFACESEHAAWSGRSMWGSVWEDGELHAAEDMDLVPAYVVQQARRMVRTVTK